MAMLHSPAQLMQVPSSLKLFHNSINLKYEVQPITSNRAPCNDVTTLMGYLSLVQRILIWCFTAHKNATEICTLSAFYASQISFASRKKYEITHRNATAKCSPHGC